MCQVPFFLALAGGFPRLRAFFTASFHGPSITRGSSGRPRLGESLRLGGIWPRRYGSRRYLRRGGFPKCLGGDFEILAKGLNIVGLDGA